jgi:hypothetical protein
VLDGVNYSIGESWIEYWSYPNRINSFVTRKEISDDLILCIPLLVVDDSMSHFMFPQVEIRDAQTDKYWFQSKDGVYFLDIGKKVPETFVLFSPKSMKEVVFEINLPNQTLETTPGGASQL